jgi:hypothetical protein
MSDKENPEDKGRVETGIDRSPVNQPYYRQTWGLPHLKSQTPDEVEREKAKKRPSEGNWSLAVLRQKMAERGSDNQFFCSSERSFPVPKRNRTPRVDYLKTGQKLAAHLGSVDKNDLPEIMWDELRPVLDQFDEAESDVLLAAICCLDSTSRKIIIFDYGLIEHFEIDFDYEEDELNQAVAKFKVFIQAILVFLRVEHMDARDLFRPPDENDNNESPSSEEENQGEQSGEPRVVLSDPISPQIRTILLSDVGSPILSKETAPDDPKEEEVIAPESGFGLWPETLPLFNGQQISLQDLVAAERTLPEDTLSGSRAVSKFDRSLFFWLDWEATGLPLFERIIPLPSDDPPITIAPEEASSVRQIIADPSNGNRAQLEKNKLILTEEQISLLNIEFVGGGLKKAGIDSPMAKIIAGLSTKQITVLYFLGVKNRTLATTMKYVGMHEKYTAGVFMDEIVLPILAKINH